MQKPRFRVILHGNSPFLPSSHYVIPVLLEGGNLKLLISSHNNSNRKFRECGLAFRQSTISVFILIVRILWHTIHSISLSRREIAKKEVPAIDAREKTMRHISVWSIRNIKSNFDSDQFELLSNRVITCTTYINKIIYFFIVSIHKKKLKTMNYIVRNFVNDFAN